MEGSEWIGVWEAGRVRGRTSGRRCEGAGREGRKGHDSKRDMLGKGKEYGGKVWGEG